MTAGGASSVDQVLTETQRNILENTVEAARVEAEKGADEALRWLTVEAPKAGSHLVEEAHQVLRRNLRAHARSLGDRLLPDGRQEIARLAAECAYAHWHRMLFARFLAENALLLHPEEGYAIAIDELQEWADEWKLKSRWEAAARCAARMLPQIFGASGVVLNVELPRNRQGELERLLEALPAEVFRTRDALGWVYQFWQSAEKKRINQSETKIGADELPAVTQLFTEPYMVDFLLQNTLGAWWAGRHPGEELPVEMPYLRFIDDLRTAPAAGTFNRWPKTAKELKVIDPCCGSGHFLVAVFDMLVAFRMREEGLRALPAVCSVLTENLHGLELDPRCTQIAAFAVAFRAWTFVGRWFELPQLHIACVGLGIRAEKKDWLALANGNDRFRNGMSNLYDLFAQAPVLGSLIDPAAVLDPLLETSFEELTPLLETALGKEKWVQDDDAREMGAVAQGVAKAAALLAQRYTLMCTNPPYLVRNKQVPELAKFCATHHHAAKHDIATVFLSRLLALGTPGSAIAAVVPQNWMFLGSYKSLRAHLLAERTLCGIANLGPAAFQVMNWWAIKTSLVVITNDQPSADHRWLAIDLGDHKVTSEKPGLLCADGPVQLLLQASQLDNPDQRISLQESAGGPLLQEIAAGTAGIVTGDSSRFYRYFWEIPLPDEKWEFLQGTVGATTHFGGMEQIVFWENGNGTLRRFAHENRRILHEADQRGSTCWGRPGVAISQMGRLPASRYLGNKFDSNLAVIVPRNPALVAPLWCYCSSDEFAAKVRAIDSKTNVTNATLVKVPFDLSRWQKVADEQYPNGLPIPSSTDCTQWLFGGDIITSTRPLQVAVARLVGYQWPDQPDDAALDPMVDNDGLVCVPAVRQEQPAADRLVAMLAAAYGAAWSPAKLDELLALEGAAGMTLDGWLRNRFFEQHSELLGHRPFVWQVWDGLRDGFSVLIHYHRLTMKTMETLIAVDLGDWINRQDEAAQGGVKGADLKLAAARKLQATLQKIADGEEPYDIFVRWKRLDKQPLGWDPDINDGVRLNIRPFVTAGVLRKPPKIHWRSDRGGDPASAPWYATFKGERVNDHHLTLKEKQNARTAKTR